MKKKITTILTLCSACALVTLVGCNEETVKVPTELTITNKTDLSADWTVGDADRQLLFSFGEVELNVASEITKGNLKIVSDSTSVAVLGSYVSAVEAGSAVVTASYTIDNGEDKEDTVLTDSFTVTVKESQKEETPVVLSSLKEFKEAEYDADAGAKKSYLVKGKIKGFGSKEASLSESAADAAKYGNLYLEDSDGTTLQIYGSTTSNTAISFADGKYKFSNPQNFLTSTWTQELKVGDEVTMVLIRCDYKGAIEGTGYFVTGNEGKRVEATELDIASVFSASHFSKQTVYKLYHTKGIIKGFGSKEASLTEDSSNGGAYGNMFLTDLDGKGSYQVYGATAESTAIAWNGTTYAFTNPKTWKENEVSKALKVGDTVEFDVFRCDYNGTLEINGDNLKVVK